jgi:hypothetical protein
MGLAADMRLSVTGSAGASVHSAALSVVYGSVASEVALTQLTPGATCYVTVSNFDTAQTYAFTLPFAQLGGQRNTRPQYFYVPAGTRRIAMVAETPPLKFYRPSGLQLDAGVSAFGPNMYVVDVPQGDDGKAWGVSYVKTAGASGFSFLNVPNALSPLPQQLLVPPGVP